MFKSHSQAIYELLGADQHAAHAEIVPVAYAEHQATGKPLADVILEAGYLDRSEFLQLIAGHLGLAYRQSIDGVVTPELAAQLQPELGRNYGVIPCHS